MTHGDLATLPSSDGTITYSCDCGFTKLLYHGNPTAVQFAHLASVLKTASTHTCKKGR